MCRKLAATVLVTILFPLALWGQSDSLVVDDSIYIGGPSDGDSEIYFFEAGSATGRKFSWKNSNNHFLLDDSLSILGTLFIQPDYGGKPLLYNNIGGGTPESGFILDHYDLFMNGDVEISGRLFLDTYLYMTPSGTDVDQSIYFSDDASRTGEKFGWDDSDDAFVLTDDLLFNTSFAGIKAIQSIDVEIDDDNDSTTQEWRLYHNGSTNSGTQLAEFQESGNLRIRGTLTENQFSDLAESFLKSEAIRPGDLVRVDPERKDAIRLASAGASTGLLGVVSERPGIVLGGPGFSPDDLETIWGSDVRRRFETEQQVLETELLLEHADLAARLAPGQGDMNTHEAAERTEVIAAARDDLLGLALERFGELHLAPVALAGRVEVNIDASTEPLSVGDHLTVGPTPGTAVKATAPGMTIGTALEALEAGPGEVLTFVHLGWFGAAETGSSTAADAPDESGTSRSQGGSTVAISPTVDDPVIDGFSIAVSETSGAGTALRRLDVEGDLYVQGSIRTGSQLVAEYRMVSEPVAAGDVLVADRERPGLLEPGTSAADRAVVGIAAGRPGVLTGSRVSAIAELMPEVAAELAAARSDGDPAAEQTAWQEMRRAFEAVHAPLAMSGIVRAKVDASYGAIQVGDLLTTSATRGHAMRASAVIPGTIVAKALEPLESGTGIIEVLVMLR